jgi:mRNA interferase MazF
VVRYQWNIFWADLDPAKGSEQAGKRPVLVISAEEANLVLPIVAIMAITSLKEGRRIYPIEVLLSANDTGLSKDSIAMAHQIRAISKDRLGDKCGEIKDNSVREQIREAMRVYLDL